MLYFVINIELRNIKVNIHEKSHLVSEALPFFNFKSHYEWEYHHFTIK